MRLAVLCLLLSIPCWSQKFTQTCAHPSFPDPKAKPIDSACVAEGNGGDDANQNPAKNNFCAKETAEEISFSDLRQLQADVKDDGTIRFGDRAAPNHCGKSIQFTSWKSAWRNATRKESGRIFQNG